VAGGLPWQAVPYPREVNLMLDVARRTAVLPATSGRWAWALLSISGFGWLLSQDAIHPLVVFSLELFLSF